MMYNLNLRNIMYQLNLNLKKKKEYSSVMGKGKTNPKQKHNNVIWVHKCCKKITTRLKAQALFRTLALTSSPLNLLCDFWQIS